MKKILALVVVSIFLASTIVVASTELDNSVETNDNQNVIYVNQDQDDCGCDLQTTQDSGGDVLYVGERPVTNFPPKSDFAKSLIDPDPEMTVAVDDLPSQFSWLDYDGDWTTPAKDQGSCGSCWAFGALGGLESSINIKSGYHNLDLDLSEQYILSCLPAAGSCGGGWMSEAIAYIHSSESGSTGNGINGVPIESCMPYQAVDYIPCSDKCDDWDTYSEPPQETDKLWQVEDYGVTTGSEDDENHWNLMKSWIIDHGPIIVDIYVSSGWRTFGWNNHDPDDVYENDDSGITNHAQVLCGWVDDDQITNGGYWIIKNSWGTGWGYNGFTNIAYGCNSLGTRDVTWVEAKEWPQQDQGPGPGPIDMHVFADYDWEPKYPHLGEEVEFTDTSEGSVVLWEWDFDGDGIIDSTDKRPEWMYTEEGEYEVKLTVWSTWGLSSNRTYTIGAKEVWPPVAVIQPEDYADNEQEVHFEGRYSYDVDAGGSIESYHWDFGDGTTSDESHVNHYFEQGDQIYEVTLTVTDNDGASNSKTVEVKIDQTVPPVTTIKHGLGSNGDIWYSTTQKISFEATDWTSVIYTYYRIDDAGGNWINYNPLTRIPISGEGMHTVEAYSVDYYGNEESPVSETFGIDKTDPTLDISISGTPDNGWYAGPVTVTLTGSDSLSGILKLMYKEQGESSWTDYASPFEISDGGTTTLICAAVDNAGNTYQEIIQINIDPAPIKPTIDGPSSGDTGVEYTFEFTSTDPFQDDVSYYIDWGDGQTTGWTGFYASGQTYTTTHSWSTEGTYQVKAKAKDTKGSESDWSILTMTAPNSQSPNLIVRLLQKLIDLFPILEPILQPIIDNYS